ncbi:MAG: hypothetical protein IKS69_07720 [Erysipelotrichaceae bacterium]|nr:hypothetical protein [Erysipelotrichaceae bacterium]
MNGEEARNGGPDMKVPVNNRRKYENTGTSKLMDYDDSFLIEDNLKEGK